MNRLQWRWKRYTQNIDHGVMTLIFLAGLVFVIELMGIQPREQRLAELKQAVAAATVSLEQAPSTLPGALTRQAPLPPVSRLTTDLATLHKLARDNGLVLQKTDYQLSREGRYWRYQVSSEGEFAYPVVSRFVAASLDKLPHLALDTLSLSRTSADNGKPTIKLGLSFYFADTAPARQSP